MDIGSILVNQQFAVPVTLYDTEKLQADLSAGVANVMAGVGGAHVLDIDTGQGFALFRHTAAVYDAPAGTGYTGDLRCALGITSNGLMAGFNRKSDGKWINSLVIDATTGSATFTGAVNATSGNFTGTVTAGSIITGSVTIAGAAGNKTLDAIIAASGSYTTADLESDLAAGIGKIVAGTGSDYRLTVDPANGFIVAGRIGSVFKGTAATGVNRPALGISANGIAMGYNRSSDGLWVDGVAIDSSGNASFSGSINATSGNFTGTVNAGSFVQSGVKLDNSSGNTIASLGTTANWASVASRPVNIAALTGTEAILNSQITITAGAITGIGTGSGTAVANSSISVQSNGLLVGGGGGQVTIGGLGYNGALDATRNAVTYSSTAPTSPTNGDLWCDTSVQPYAWKMRVAGAWQTSANLINSSTPVANYIAANSIAADRLSVTSLSAISANLGTITAGSLSAAVTYAGSITAGQITAGTLAAGVIYSGTIAANKITAGTITAALSINSSGSINAMGAYGSAVGNAAVVGAPSSAGAHGVAGISTGMAAGVYGRATGNVISATGVFGEATNAAGVGVCGWGTGTGIAVFADGSGRIAVGGTNVQIRQVSGVLRVTDTYTTDAYLLMISSYGTGSGTTATLGAKLGTNAAMAGWMTCKVEGATVYVPYWT